MASRLLAGALALSVTSGAQASGWLEKLSQQVHAMQGHFKAPRAPDIAQTDLFGAPFRLSELSGRVVVLSFLDRDSVGEAIEWLQRQTTWMLHQPEISFVNVFYPGGISVMVPRGEVVHRIRGEVNASTRRFRDELPPADRALLDGADIRWVVDWKRHNAARYPVERGRVNLFLLDDENRIRQVLRYDPRSPTADLQAGVRRLLKIRRGKGPAGAAGL